MKHFIDFGIYTEKVKTKNILGKNIESQETYIIYKSWFWGLFKRFLKFSVKNGWNIAANVYVNYMDVWYATKFYNIYECNQLIEDMKENPNKYILK